MRVTFLRKINIFLFLNFFILYSFCNALVISEIQFDPVDSDTGREWLEVYNDSANQVDLTGYYFSENAENHGINIFNLPNSTEKNLLPGEYAVIAQDINKFKNDFQNFSGKIFKASFSLSNTSENLSLKDSAKNIIHSIFYSATLVGSAEGVSVCTNVLEIAGNLLYKCTSNTPGSQNLYDPNSGSTNSSASSTNTSTSTTTTDTDESSNQSIDFYYRSPWPESEKIYVKAGENRVVSLGQQIYFNPKILDGDKKEIKSGAQYKWNFGDGYESILREGKHTFKFLGEFVVGLQVNYLGSQEEDKLYIKVVEPKLSLKIIQKEFELGTSTQKYFADVVEINNENNFEINIGGMQIKNEENKIFILPEKLFILPGRQIFLPPELTGFATNTSQVELQFASGKVLNIYSKKSKTSPKQISNENESLNLKSASTTEVYVYTKEKFAELEKQKVILEKSKGSIIQNKINFKNNNKIVVQEIKPKNLSDNTKTEVSGKIEFKPNQPNLFQKFKNLFEQ